MKKESLNLHKRFHYLFFSDRAVLEALWISVLRLVAGNIIIIITTVGKFMTCNCLRF
jgi:hypothetical protein